MAGDDQFVIRDAFRARLRLRLRSFVDDDLLAAHKKAPNGPHGDRLSQILRYFRSAPIGGKLAILAERHFASYRVVVLSGQRGVPPRYADDRRFATEDEAAHAVFLLRVQELLSGE